MCEVEHAYIKHFYVLSMHHKKTTSRKDVFKLKNLTSKLQEKSEENRNQQNKVVANI